MILLHAFVNGYCRDIALFEHVGDVVCVDASLDACCEDNEYHIPTIVFYKMWGANALV